MAAIDRSRSSAAGPNQPRSPFIASICAVDDRRALVGFEFGEGGGDHEQRADDGEVVADLELLSDGRDQGRKRPAMVAELCPRVGERAERRCDALLIAGLGAQCHCFLARVDGACRGRRS